MFIELTDLLTCPRCGPDFGLVLLTREMDGRRVLSGWLGCPNCRNDYPISGGMADLRTDPEAQVKAGQPLEDEELALKIAALCGLSEGGGLVLLGERVAHAAAPLSELLPELEVIAFRKESDDSEERHGVSRVVSEAAFPLASHKLRAVAVAPGGDAQLVEAAARCVAAEGRVVLFDAKANDVDELERSGLTVAAQEGRTAVAERGAGSVVDSN